MRLAVVLLIWIGAGLIAAAFSIVYVEAPTSVFGERLDMFFEAPLVLANGLAWAIVPGHYNGWAGRETCEWIVTILLTGVFLWHTWRLARLRSAQLFFFSALAQTVVLFGSAYFVLRCSEWDFTHMHG